MMKRHDSERFSKGAMSRHLPRRGRAAAGSRNKPGMTVEGFAVGTGRAGDCMADAVFYIQKSDSSGSYNHPNNNCDHLPLRHPGLVPGSSGRASARRKTELGISGRNSSERGKAP